MCLISVLTDGKLRSVPAVYDEADDTKMTHAPGRAFLIQAYFNIAYFACRTHFRSPIHSLTRKPRR